MKFSENAITDDSELDAKFLHNAERAGRIAARLKDGDTATLPLKDSNRGLLASLSAIGGLRIWQGRKHVEVTRIYGGAA